VLVGLAGFASERSIQKPPCLTASTPPLCRTLEEREDVAVDLILMRGGETVRGS